MSSEEKQTHYDTYNAKVWRRDENPTAGAADQLRRQISSAARDRQ
jgi:hypothetical protein